MAEKLCEDRPVSTLVGAPDVSGASAPVTLRDQRGGAAAALGDELGGDVVGAAGPGGSGPTKNGRLADHVADPDVADRGERRAGGA